MFSEIAMTEIMITAREMVEQMEILKPSEELLQFLRHKNDSKLVSIKIISIMFNLSILEAKILVHSSQTPIPSQTPSQHWQTQTLRASVQLGRAAHSNPSFPRPLERVSTQDALAEIALVQFFCQNRFVNFLEFGQSEGFGQELEG